MKKNLIFNLKSNQSTWDGLVWRRKCLKDFSGAWACKFSFYKMSNWVRVIRHKTWKSESGGRVKRVKGFWGTLFVWIRDERDTNWPGYLTLIYYYRFWEMENVEFSVCWWKCYCLSQIKFIWPLSNMIFTLNYVWSNSVTFRENHENHSFWTEI